MKNPFKFGEIVTGENFCNREKELKEIRKAIKNGYSFWIYSPRRFGKSSLIFRSFKNLQNKSIKTIYFDMYNIQTIDDFARKYAVVLTEELFDWKMEIKKLSQKIGDYFKNLFPKISLDSSGTPSVSFELHKIDSQANIEEILKIPEAIAKKNQIQICIAFDEFQEIKRIGSFLINWMRSVFQLQKNVSYIFSGSKQSLMESIFADTNSPLYEYGFKMPIYPISKNDFSHYIKKQFKKTNLEIPDRAIAGILDKSKGHPHFTQYFSSVVWDLIFEDTDADEKNFDNIWMKKIIDSQSVIFQNIYDQLNYNQRKTLKAISFLEKGDKLFSMKYRKKYNMPTTSTITSTINSLIKKNLIHKKNTNYEIENPVFAEWMKKL